MLLVIFGQDVFNQMIKSHKIINYGSRYFLIRSLHFCQTSKGTQWLFGVLL